MVLKLLLMLYLITQEMTVNILMNMVIIKQLELIEVKNRNIIIGIKKEKMESLSIGGGLKIYLYAMEIMKDGNNIFMEKMEL